MLTGVGRRQPTTLNGPYPGSRASDAGFCSQPAHAISTKQCDVRVGVMVKKFLLTATILLFDWISAAPGSAQGGWLLIVPPVDERKMEALPKDPAFQGMSFGEKKEAVQRSVVNKKAPLAEWVQNSAFDLARECEDFKSGLVGAQTQGDLNRSLQEHKKWTDPGARAQEEKLAREKRELRQQLLDMQGDQQKRKELEALLEAQDRRQKEAMSQMNLRTLADHVQLEEGRCVPASAVFPLKP